MVRCLWIPQQREGEESQIQQRTCLVVKWSISKTYRFSFLSLISNRYVICLNAFSKRPISMLFTSNLNNFSIKGTNFNSFSSSSHHHLFLLLLHRHRMPYWCCCCMKHLWKLIINLIVREREMDICERLECWGRNLHGYVVMAFAYGWSDIFN